MLQQFLIDYLGKDIAVGFSVFLVLWMIIFTLFMIYAIVRFCGLVDRR